MVIESLLVLIAIGAMLLAVCGSRNNLLLASITLYTGVTMWLSATQSPLTATAFGAALCLGVMALVRKVLMDTVRPARG